MPKALRPLLLVLILLGLPWGCARPGASLVDTTIELLDEAVRILEANESHPETAVEAFRAYLEKNEVRLRALEEETDRVAAKLTAEDRTALKHRFLERIAPLEKRLRKIVGAYRGHPEVLARLEEIGRMGLDAERQGARP